MEFLALGLVLSTALLLASALAIYDFIIQIAIRINLIRSENTITSRQVFGQLVLSMGLFGLTVIILWYFKPYGSAKTPMGVERGIDIAEGLRGVPPVIRM